MVKLLKRVTSSFSHNGKSELWLHCLCWFIEPRLLRAQVHSTTSLPQRRWSSNSVQDQRVSRPTTFSLRNSGRPMSTLGSRPVSGFSNRPVSGRISAQSRPGTALNKSVPPLLLQDSRSDVSIFSLI